MFLSPFSGAEVCGEDICPEIVGIYNSSFGADLRFDRVEGISDYAIMRKYKGEWSVADEISIEDLESAGGHYRYIDKEIKDSYGQGYIYSVAYRNEENALVYDKSGLALYRLQQPSISHVEEGPHGQITVSWYPLDVHGYELQCSDDGGASFYSLGITDDHMMRVNGSGDVLIFRLRSYKENKDRGRTYSQYSEWKRSERSVQAPVLSNVYNSVYGADLRFRPTEGADEYFIMRKKGGIWSQIEKTEASSLEKTGEDYKYIDKSVSEEYGEGYIYSVAVKSASGELVFDERGLAFYRLKNPDIESVELKGYNEAEVKWTGQNCQGYEVQYSSDNGKTWIKAEQVDDGNILSQKIGGLEGSTNYVFRTRCKKVNKDRGTIYSSYSSWKGITTGEEPLSYTINYVLNGGKNNENNPSSYIQGDTLKLYDPIRENYSFSGWYRESAYTNRVERIEEDMSGDITLYARWRVKALNINDEGLDDMIWSWWYYPQAVSDNGKLFWAFATSDGGSGVACFDPDEDTSNKTILKRVDQTDDHNGAALTLLDDKRIMVSYAGGHDKDRYIHIRISDEPLNISSFSDEIVLESVGKTSYSQILKNNGKYWLFYRVNNHSWAYRMSEDGFSWSEEVILIRADTQYYCRFVNTETDDLIRILMYSNPAGKAPEIRMGFFDTDDRSVYDSDRSRVLKKQRNQYTDFTIIQDVSEGKTQRLFDVAITPAEKTLFLYASFTNTKGMNDSVYYLYEDGVSFEICLGGKHLNDPLYQPGASFIDDKTIVLARNEEGTDFVELYSFEEGRLSKTLCIDMGEETGDQRLARPIADVNGRFILYHQGYYNPNKYTDYATDGAIYIIGENRLIR